MERFQCEPFGTVTVTRRAGARNIRIKIEAESLSVSADYYTCEKDIIKLLEENYDKILEKQQALKSNTKRITDNSVISNRYFSLRILKDSKLSEKYLFSLKAESKSAPFIFTLYCNDNIDFSNTEVQERIVNVINQLIRNIAKGILQERTMQLADKFGFEVNSVRTKITRSKWGSCSSMKNINLSAHLILLPERLQDFVITHELCHLKEMNHSARFHALVNHYTGGREAELEKELKKYSPNILDYIEKSDN